MASQSLLAKLGMRSGTLGSSASLAVAMPLSEGAVGMDAHTASNRSGLYGDQTASAEKLAFMVGGQVGPVFQSNGTSVSVTIGGNLTITPVAASSGVQTALTVNGAANTLQTSGVEVIDANFNLTRTVQWATSVPATQRAVVFTPPTYSCNTPAQTITNAATVCITGQPVGGTNVGISTAYALWVQTGLVNFANKLLLTGVNAFQITQTATTGTSPYIINVAGGAHLVLASGVEATDIILNLARTVQFTTSTPATQRAITISPPTYSCDTVSQTITSAATLAIAGAPANGTNVTITNPYALWVQAGTSLFAGQIVGTSVNPFKISQSIGNATVPIAMSVTGGAHTLVTSGNEAIDVNFNLSRTVQWATTTPATQRAFLIQAPTYSCNSVSQTITTAATLAINSAPGAGTNVTITSAYALWVQGSASLFQGQVRITTSTAPLAITQGAAASGSPTGFSFIGGAHLTLTSGAEDLDVSFNLARTVQFATSTPTTQRAVLITPPTYSCDTAAQTITTAATFTVNGAPAAGTNVTLTNSYAIWVQAGTSAFSGNVLVGSSAGGQAQLLLNSAAANNRDLDWQTAGVLRWQIRGDSTAESGSNAGTALLVTAFTDAGASIDSPLTIVRASAGLMTLGGTTSRPMTVTGITTFSNTTVSSSASTGALIVGGGIGTGQASYFQGKLTLAGANGLAITTSVNVSGIPTLLSVTGPANTGLTSGTEATDVLFNLARTVQWATSTPATQRAVLIQAPTYACDTISQTIGVAATVAITGAPVAGTNVTISSPYALWVQAGQVVFGSSFNAQGSASFTGTNAVSIIQAGVASAIRTTFSATPCNATTVTAATEDSQFIWNAHSIQWATSTPATQREFQINAPTYSCDTAAQTITSAATLAIVAAPIAGTNVTITNAYALWVQGGLSSFGSRVQFLGGSSIQVIQPNVAGGAPYIFNATGGVNTSLTSATEVSDIVFNLAQVKTWATSTPTTQRAVYIQAPTYACNTVSQTITTAATVAISGPPVAGTNVTLTNTYSLWVQGSGIQQDMGSITVSTPGITTTATLNGAAVVFGAIWLMNLTNTLSSASSVFMDIQLGGVPQFTVKQNLFAVAANLPVTIANTTTAGSSITGALVVQGSIATPSRMWCGAPMLTDQTLWTSIVKKTSNYTATTADSIIFVDCTTGNVTITLPSPNGFSNKTQWLRIVRIDSSANTCSILPAGTNKLNGVNAAITVPNTVGATRHLTADQTTAVDWYMNIA